MKHPKLFSCSSCFDPTSGHENTDIKVVISLRSKQSCWCDACSQKSVEFVCVIVFSLLSCSALCFGPGRLWGSRRHLVFSRIHFTNEVYGEIRRRHSIYSRQESVFGTLARKRVEQIQRDTFTTQMRLSVITTSRNYTPASGRLPWKHKHRLVTMETQTAAGYLVGWAAADPRVQPPCASSSWCCWSRLPASSPPSERRNEAQILWVRVRLKSDWKSLKT